MHHSWLSGISPFQKNSDKAVDPLEALNPVATPRVSIVIPCYNYGRFLRECVSSALGQSGNFELEVIALNDGSTDDTATVLASFRDPRLKVITHVKNQGHVVTINEGLSAATGDYVARIDADDRLRPDFLSRAIPILENDPTLGAVYANIVLIDESGKVTDDTGRLHPERGDRRWDGYLALLAKNFICGTTLVARRAHWQAALPIEAWMTHSDWFLNLGIARQAPLYYLDAALGEYRVHSSNLHSALSRNKTEEETTFRILEKFLALPESSDWLTAKKKQLTGEIRATHYIDLGLKYYWEKYYDDARRCFLQAAKNAPKLLFTPRLARIAVSLLVGPKLYEQAKQVALRRK